MKFLTDGGALLCLHTGRPNELWRYGEENYAIMVYLPAGGWKPASTGKAFQGGQVVSVNAPIDDMPVFERML